MAKKKDFPMINFWRVSRFNCFSQSLQRYTKSFSKTICYIGSSVFPTNDKLQGYETFVRKILQVLSFFLIITKHTSKSLSVSIIQRFQSFIIQSFIFDREKLNFWLRSNKLTSVFFSIYYKTTIKKLSIYILQRLLHL